MTDRLVWTPEAIAAYARLHRLPLPSGAFADRLRAMAQKAADAAAALPRDFDREDQPAFSFTPGLSRKPGGRR